MQSRVYKHINTRLLRTHPDLTPVTSKFSVSYKSSVWDQPLHFQQPPLNTRLNSAQTTLVESSATHPSVVSPNQLHMPAAQAHTSFQALPSSNQVQFLTPK